MDFRGTIVNLSSAFRDANIEFALIGGFALAALGVPRNTGDLDFLAPGDRAADIDRIMESLGYRALFRSNDAANFAGMTEAHGHVDFLFARRPYSLRMLERAPRLPLLDLEGVKVVEAEDLIGLKVQASSNNPSRHALDVGDIVRLLAVHDSLDLDRVREYFRLFDREAELDALLRSRGATG